jgi:hypothetical protein
MPTRPPPDQRPPRCMPSTFIQPTVPHFPRVHWPPRRCPCRPRVLVTPTGPHHSDTLPFAPPVFKDASYFHCCPVVFLSAAGEPRRPFLYFADRLAIAMPHHCLFFLVSRSRSTRHFGGALGAIDAAPPSSESPCAALPCPTNDFLLLVSHPAGAIPSIFFVCGALMTHSWSCRFAQTHHRPPSSSFARRNAIRY